MGEIHERLNAIDGQAAAWRAARILAGPGFDEEAQQEERQVAAAG